MPRLNARERAEIWEKYHNNPKRPIYAIIGEEYGVSAKVVYVIINKKESPGIPKTKGGDDRPRTAMEAARIKAGLPLDPKNGQLPLETRSVDDLTEGQRQKIIDIFQHGDTTMTQLAKMYHVSPFEVWDLIQSEPDAKRVLYAREDLVKDDILHTIQRIIKLLFDKADSAPFQTAAITLGILLDKYQALTGKPTAIIRNEVIRASGGNKSGPRAQAETIVTEALSLVRDIKERSTPVSKGKPGLVSGVLLPGQHRRHDPAAVVSPGVAAGDAGSSSSPDNSPEGSRQDDSDSSPSDLGAGQKPESANKDRVPVGRESDRTPVRDNAASGAESEGKGGVPEPSPSG